MESWSQTPTMAALRIGAMDHMGAARCCSCGARRPLASLDHEQVGVVRVLISGAGVAGPTLGYWLRRHQIDATLVEQAPRLRTGGYIVDFWGAGYDLAERIGVLPQLERKGYHVREVRMVDRQGQRVGGFSAGVFDRLTDWRFLSIGDSIVDIQQSGQEVRVLGLPFVADLTIGRDLRDKITLPSY
jgi:hypothetical protein